MNISYFTYSTENKYKLRMNLTFLLASYVIRNKQTHLNKELTTLGILTNLKNSAIIKEDYEMLELITDVIKNKEYLVYGKL